MMVFKVIKFIHLVCRRALGMELVFMKDSFELLYIDGGHLNYFLFLLLRPLYSASAIFSKNFECFCDSRD